MRHNDEQDFPKWSGSFREWRDLMNFTQVQAAQALECSRSKIIGLEKDDSSYRLTASERTKMFLMLERKVEQMVGRMNHMTYSGLKKTYSKLK
jgi:DNA-binding XRE family transcriptional regulator